MDTPTLRLDIKLGRSRETYNDRETVILFDAWLEVQHPYIQHVVQEHIEALTKSIENFGEVSAKVLLSEVYLEVYKHTQAERQMSMNGKAAQ